MPPLRPSLSITLPPHEQFQYTTNRIMPRTPEAQQAEQQSAVEPPPPPRPQAFKIKRKRVSSAPFQEPEVMSDTDTNTTTTIIPTIEMSEVPAEVSSPTIQPTSAHLLSPIPLAAALPRALTPPKTPAPRLCTPFSQLESPAEEWDLINKTKPSFERAGSVCSSFSDSSISSCGSSAFSLPTGGYDSPDSEAPDPFTDHDSAKHEKLIQSPILNDDGHPTKRAKTRRDAIWTPQMDDHLWMTFMAYLSDPTLTPFKMLPGSTPPMGVCDQVATKAKRNWRPRKSASVTMMGSIDALCDPSRAERAGSPDTIRPSTLQTTQPKWPSGAATRRRLRKLCQRRPYISAHYQRMLRTRSPSPFETSSPNNNASSSFGGYEMHKSLITSTATSMQPNGVLAQLASDETPQQTVQPQRQIRPEGWFDRIPRSKAHQKSASLQSELKLSLDDLASQPNGHLASPFDIPDAASGRTHLLRSMANTKSLGRTEFNGKSLDSPVEFKMGAPTARRSRKRRFRSDEEKPRRPPLEDVFGPPMPETSGRNRGFSVGAVRASDNLANLFTPPLPNQNYDHVMSEAPANLATVDEIPFGARSAPRRLAEPIPRLGSPFVESSPPNRQHNTFPRSLLPTTANQEPFHQRLLQLASQHASSDA